MARLSWYALVCDTNLLCAPFIRTSFGSRSFSVAAPKIWNSLPPALRMCTSHDTFRHQLKTHYTFIMTFANLPLTLQLKEFENRSTFGEVTDKSIVACFFDSHCTSSRPSNPLTVFSRIYPAGYALFCMP